MIKINGTSVTIELTVEDVKKSILQNAFKFKNIKELTDEQYIDILHSVANKIGSIGFAVNVVSECYEFFGKSWEDD